MKIKLDSVEYEMLMPDDMTLGEQREFEKIADAGVDKLETLETEYRAGLVVAWMAVSIHRAAPNQSMHQIVDRLDQLKPDDLKDAFESRQAGQSPPVEESKNGNDDSTKTSETGSVPGSAPDPENENLPGFGGLLSPIGATSDPETSAG